MSVFMNTDLLEVRGAEESVFAQVQWSVVTVTPLGIGKSVTVTDCHSNSSFPCQYWRVRMEPTFYPFSQFYLSIH